MFVKVTNGQVTTYPYTVGQLRRDNPNTSFPKSVPQEMLVSFGVFPVEYDDEPVYNPMTHRIEHSSQPVLKDNRWVLTKTVVALTTDQIADRDAAKAKSVRSQRDSLLAESDWTQVPDAPVDQAAWKTYRQALRDITTQSGFPHEVTWPVKPE